jgi:FkbM family methyltransferase
MITRTDTSQNGETEVVRRYFKNKIGLYLDIGANDGITLSNTYGLYQDGWYGVNMEPSKAAYDKLCIAQPEAVNINAAIGTLRGKATLFESGTHLGLGDTSLVSTLIPEEMNRWKKEKFSPVQVDVMTIDLLCPKGEAFDLLSLDVEGMELQVLPSIMEHLIIGMAIVEWNGKHRSEFDAIMKGYKLYYSNGENLIYVRG